MSEDPKYLLHPGEDDEESHQHFVNAVRAQSGLPPLYEEPECSEDEVPPQT